MEEFTYDVANSITFHEPKLWLPDEGIYVMTWQLVLHFMNRFMITWCLTFLQLCSLLLYRVEPLNIQKMAKKSKLQLAKPQFKINDFVFAKLRGYCYGRVKLSISNRNKFKFIFTEHTTQPSWTFKMLLHLLMGCITSKGIHRRNIFWKALERWFVWWHIDWPKISYKFWMKSKTR